MPVSCSFRDRQTSHQLVHQRREEPGAGGASTRGGRSQGSRECCGSAVLCVDVSTLDPTAQIIIVTISIVQRKSLHTERFRNLPKVTQLIRS